MNRYSRHIILNEVGQAGQDKLLNSKILVVGAGGLGCPVLQYLAAAGIGCIGIVDHDSVDESNLQRQILYGKSSLGNNKALAAKERLEDLNDTIEIIAYPYQLNAENALDLFKAYDIIVDGTDTIKSRYLISDAALMTNKPVVYGAIYKFEGQVAVFNYKDGPSYRCLFPSPPKSGSIASCSDIGVLGVLPGIIGTMQANEVIKIVLGMNGVLSGKILCYDARTTNSYLIKLNPSKDEKSKIRNQDELLEIETDDSCEPIQSISAELALRKTDATFIDVREHHELPKIEVHNLIQIPLGSLTDRIDEIDHSKDIIVFCQSGIRSARAIQILTANGMRNCYNLEAGASAILNQLNTKIL